MRELYIDFIKMNLGDNSLKPKYKFTCIKCEREVSNCYSFRKGKGKFIDTKISTWICPYCVIDIMKELMVNKKNVKN